MSRTRVIRPSPSSPHRSTSPAASARSISSTVLCGRSSRYSARSPTAGGSSPGWPLMASSSWCWAGVRPDLPCPRLRPAQEAAQPGAECEQVLVVLAGQLIHVCHRPVLPAGPVPASALPGQLNASWPRPTGGAGWPGRGGGGRGVKRGGPARLAGAHGRPAPSPGSPPVGRADRSFTRQPGRAGRGRLPATGWRAWSWLTQEPGGGGQQAAAGSPGQHRHLMSCYDINGRQPGLASPLPAHSGKPGCQSGCAPC